MRLEDSRVAIPGTSNVRDLGGYPARDGATIRREVLFRGEALAHPGASEVHAIWDPEHEPHYRALRLRTVIDLRAAGEVAQTPSAWALATGAQMLALPIEEGGEGSDTNYMRRLLAGEIITFNENDLADFYVVCLERRAAVFAEAIRVLTDETRLPLLVHCAAGKDRTGLFVALLLEVLGTPRDVVVEDYALTGVFRPNRVAAYADMFTRAGIEPHAVRTLFETPASAMERALEHLDVQHGGAAGYLSTAGGLSAAELTAVRRHLLT